MDVLRGQLLKLPAESQAITGPLEKATRLRVGGPFADFLVLLCKPQFVHPPMDGRSCLQERPF